MTADPSRSPERPPAWWVATDQGVVLAGPYDDWPVALVGHARTIARLRDALEQDRRTASFIAERCAAVAPRWGELTGAWQHFRPVTRPRSGEQLDADPGREVVHGAKPGGALAQAGSGAEEDQALAVQLRREDPVDDLDQFRPA